jgi:hypothetical protein
MNSHADSLYGESVAQGVDDDINVVIVYDDLEAGQHAMEVLAGVGARTGDGGELTLQPWKFDLLSDPDWRSMAAGDVLQADILVLSSNREDGLPAHLKLWLENCLALRRNKPGAVVALMRGKDGVGDAPSRRFMHDLALRAGCEFFAPATSAAEETEAAFEDIRMRAETVTPTLAGILNRPSCARSVAGV